MKRGHSTLKSGMSSTVATVFLVMITVAAVGILWGVVFPFINNEIDLEHYDVKLEIVTAKGYTVYDPVDRFAMVQVKRSADEATLSGMEIFMDFEGQGYKTTLRAPDPGQVRRYVFNMSDLDPAEPGYTSVAPIFLERGREFVGKVTSNLIIPHANINIELADLIIQLDADSDVDTFVITLDEDLTEVDYSGCDDGEITDPWGGCAFHSSLISSVEDIGTVVFNVNLSTWNSDITGGGANSVKFVSGSDGCVSSADTCDDLDGVTSATSTVTFGTSGIVNDLNNPCIDSVVYVYDNAACS